MGETLDDLAVMGRRLERHALRLVGEGLEVEYPRALPYVRE